MEELVSVLIPVYQSVKYVQQCVESILGQAYSELEVILIDDGSTDGSSLLCDQLESQYENVKVFHQENRGVSAARNKALELAKGDYVLFVDSDDYLEGNIIEAAVKNLKNENIDLCVFGFQRVSANTYIKYDKKIPYSTDKILNLEEVRSNLLHWFSTNIMHAIGTKIYRRKIIEKFGLRFKENWEYYEDIYFCLSYINVCRNDVLFMSDVGYSYRSGNGESLSCKKVSNEGEPVFETFYLLKNMLGEQICNYENKQKFYELYMACIKRIATKSDEAVKRAEKYYEMFLVMNRWINNYLKGKTIEQFLIQRNCYSVAIYGMNYIGKTLWEELKGGKVKVKYAIDRNADNISIGLEVFKLCEDLPKVDAIIVTAINSYDAIKEQLENIGMHNIISLEEIVGSQKE